MIKYLMNGDRAVLEFSLDSPYIKVLDNQFLPYELKDYINTTNFDDFSKSLRDITIFKDFLANRTLNLSRDNAKVILNVAALSQSLNTDERIKIVMACRGLSLTDNFWIKEENENLIFKDVDLRRKHLSEASYDIAILGKHISATREELCPDLVTKGMFPKYWHRENNKVYLYKTDRFKGRINSLAEIEASRIIHEAGGNVVSYARKEKDGLIFSVSECIASEKYSLISAQAIIDWCSHTKTDVLTFIQNKGFATDFANMVIADYILANTDRHSDNWGFLIDNKTNEVKSFAPLYDLNQALVADEFDTDIRDLIYEPTGKTFVRSMQEYAGRSTLDFSKVWMSEKAANRLTLVNDYLGSHEIKPINLFSKDEPDEIEK